MRRTCAVENADGDVPQTDHRGTGVELPTSPNRDDGPAVQRDGGQCLKVKKKRSKINSAYVYASHTSSGGGITALRLLY